MSRVHTRLVAITAFGNYDHLTVREARALAESDTAVVLPPEGVAAPSSTPEGEETVQMWRAKATGRMTTDEPHPHNAQRFEEVWVRVPVPGSLVGPDDSMREVRS